MGSKGKKLKLTGKAAFAVMLAAMASGRRRHPVLRRVPGDQDATRDK